MEPTIEQLILELASARIAYDHARAATTAAVEAENVAADAVAEAQGALDLAVNNKIQAINAQS